MADVNNNIGLKGALQLLSKLQENSSSDSESALHWEKDAELRELEQEYKRLKKQKLELLEKTKEAELLDEIQTYAKQVEANDGDTENVPLGKLVKEDVLFDALQLFKERKLTEMYNIYKLAGTACVFLHDDIIQFHLDTNYKGQYFTTYYMEVKIADGKIKILKHSLPFFIPVKEIAKNYQDLDGLKDFVDVISVHLNSFISRQRQFTEAQENSNYIIEDFFASAAFDFVAFKLKFPERSRTLSIKMKYVDLKDTLPKKVEITSDDVDNSFAGMLKKYLMSTETQQALAHL